MPIQVVIADDHPVVRTGFRRLLSLEPDIEVLTECSTGEDAYHWFARHCADVLILDLSMPGCCGLETLRRLNAREQRPRVLVFSMHEAPAMVNQAFDLGATGYVSKRSAPQELADAVRAVAAGRRYLSEGIENPASPANTQRSPLSQREFIIFQQLARGVSAKQLAEQLHLSPKTVYNHQTQIYRKLAVDNAAQLTQRALQLGLLAPDIPGETAA